jgi:sorbitol-specific phosphotransferase system component IIBC
MALWDKVKKALVGETPAPDATTPPAAENSAAAAESSASPAAPATPPPADGTYKACVIEKGMRGWGGPLTIQPTAEKNLVYSVTGGGIHPVAQRIADITGAQTFDGFKSKADFSQIAVAVIDCGGTARVGVYPMKGIPTVDIHAATPSGPLFKFINETNFVSGVKVDNVREA